MTPMVRTGLTHVGTAMGGALAAIMFLATKSGDVIAIYDQLNVVVADVMKLVAVVTPIATGVYGVYKATIRSKVADLAAAPGTTVEQGGKVISLRDPELQKAAEAAKTDVHGNPSRAAFVG
jgi:hypothetical protein